MAVRASGSPTATSFGPGRIQDDLRPMSAPVAAGSSKVEEPAQARPSSAGAPAQSQRLAGPGEPEEDDEEMGDDDEDFEFEAITVQLVELFREGREEEAVRAGAEFADALRETLGDAHPQYINALAVLAALVDGTGNHEAAEALLREAEDRHEELEMEVMGQYLDEHLDEIGVLGSSEEEALAAETEEDDDEVGVRCEQRAERSPPPRRRRRARVPDAVAKAGRSKDSRHEGERGEDDCGGAFLTGVPTEGPSQKNDDEDEGEEDDQSEDEEEEEETEEEYSEDEWSHYESGSSPGDGGDGASSDEEVARQELQAQAITQLTHEVNELVAQGQPEVAAELLSQAEQLLLESVSYDHTSIQGMSRAALHTLWASVLDAVGEHDKAQALYEEAMLVLREEEQIAMLASSDELSDSTSEGDASAAATASEGEAEERPAGSPDPGRLSRSSGGGGAGELSRPGTAGASSSRRWTPASLPDDTSVTAEAPDTRQGSKALGSPPASMPGSVLGSRPATPGPVAAAASAPLQMAAAGAGAAAGSSPAAVAAASAPCTDTSLAAEVAVPASSCDGTAATQAVPSPPPPGSRSSGRPRRPAPLAPQPKAKSAEAAQAPLPLPRRAGGGFIAPPPIRKPAAGKAKAKAAAAAKCDQGGNETPASALEAEVTLLPKEKTPEALIEERAEEIKSALTTADFFLGMLSFERAADKLEEQLVALAEDGAAHKNSDLHIQVLSKYAGVLWWDGDAEGAVDAYLAADELLEGRADANEPTILRRRVDIWAQLAQVHRAVGDLDEADRRLSDAVRVLSDLQTVGGTLAAMRAVREKLHVIQAAAVAETKASSSSSAGPSGDASSSPAAGMLSSVAVAAGLVTLQQDEAPASDDMSQGCKSLSEALRDVQASLGQVCVQKKEYERAMHLYLLAFSDAADGDSDLLDSGVLLAELRAASTTAAGS